MSDITKAIAITLAAAQIRTPQDIDFNPESGKIALTYSGDFTGDVGEIDKVLAQAGVNYADPRTEGARRFTPTFDGAGNKITVVELTRVSVDTYEDRMDQSVTQKGAKRPKTAADEMTSGKLLDEVTGRIEDEAPEEVKDDEKPKKTVKAKKT